MELTEQLWDNPFMCGRLDNLWNKGIFPQLMQMETDFHK